MYYFLLKGPLSTLVGATYLDPSGPSVTEAGKLHDAGMVGVGER